MLIKWSKASLYSVLLNLRSATVALISSMYYLTVDKSAFASASDPSHLSLWASDLANAS